MFAALIYVKPWLSCTTAAGGSNNDLELYKQIKNYSLINEKISAIADIKITRHLWCLSAELVSLGLFSNLVMVEQKRLISDCRAA